MRVRSSRGRAAASLCEAITAGLAPDGGLFLPPALPPTPWAPVGGGLPAVAEALLRPYFDGEALQEQLGAIVAEAFTFPAPVRWLDAETGLLELFHGPSAAFKDFGARFLAACLARLVPHEQRVTILVATSGDTGAAVAAAFHRRPGFRVVILYPDGRVAPRQAHQLGAFGDNVRTFRVAGTFDDCQRLVKRAFLELAPADGERLISANSISLARLLPQMTYYAHAALGAAAEGRPPISFVVPTGNLGNALACLLARDRGLPIDRVVMATNANRLLPDFLAGGDAAPRPTVTTLANAMDVGAPSNLERLRHLYADPAARVTADWVDDQAIRAAIRRLFADRGAIVCPHTACGVEVLRRLRDAGWTGPTLIAATAHPAKFAEVVEPLIGQPVLVPESLAALLGRPAVAEPLAPTLAALAAQLAR